MRARRKATDPGDAHGASSRDARTSIDDGVADPRRVIVCRECTHQITEREARMVIEGDHEHTFVNPGGFIYRIGCYAEAPGCASSGGWVEEDTWFAGHAWQIRVCGRCHMHLGWAYRPLTTGGAGFHGLVVAHLAEGPEGAEG